MPESCQPAVVIERCAVLTKEALLAMLELEVLIGKLGAIDRFPTST